MTTDKTVDITVFGATGFTGQLITKLILESDEIHTRKLQIVLAGRSKEKVEQLINDNCKNRSLISVLVASVDDKDTIDRMTAQSKVLLNCVGPFAKYGDVVVKSCVENGCSYADITGEPEFINSMVAKYHTKAQENGVKIVHCVGFDSIPADIGVHHLLKQLSELAASTTDPWDENSYVAVNCYVKANMPGLISYGTYHTLVTSLSNVSVFGSKKTSRGEQENKNKKRKKCTMNRSIRWEPSVNSYVVPFSTSDPTIVNRSAELCQYVNKGQVEFHYAHYLQIEKWYNVALLVLVMLSLFLITRFSWGAKFLLKIWRQPGEGPSEEDRKKSSCQMTFQGMAKLKSGIQTVTTLCTIAGDPGYDETAKMALQSALCLHDTKKESGGDLTTAAALGDDLITRLHENSNVRFTTKKASFTRNEESEYEKIKREVSKYVYMPSSK